MIRYRLYNHAAVFSVIILADDEIRPEHSESGTRVEAERHLASTRHQLNFEDHLIKIFIKNEEILHFSVKIFGHIALKLYLCTSNTKYSLD